MLWGDAVSGITAGILAIAQGINSSASADIPETEIMEIRSLFKQLLDKDNLSGIEVPELLQVLQPDTLLERFAAKKANNLNNAKDFLSLKGQKGQLEHSTTYGMENLNQYIGFKCLHYSVTESNGTVAVTIEKKKND